MNRIFSQIIKFLIKLISIHLIFLSIHLISKMYLQDVYIFEWTSRYDFIFPWLIALIWVIFNKYTVALSMAVGHIVGLFLGLYLDERRIADVLLHYDISELTGAKYELLQSKAAYTWFYTILIFMIIGIILQKYVFKTNKPSLFDIIYESIKKFYTNVKAMISKRK